MACDNVYNFKDVVVKLGSHRFTAYAKQEESIRLDRGESAIEVLKGTDDYNILTFDVDTVATITVFLMPGGDTDKHLFSLYAQMQAGEFVTDTFSIVESNLDTGGYSNCTAISKAPNKSWGKKIGVHEWQFTCPNWIDE